MPCNEFSCPVCDESLYGYAEQVGKRHYRVYCLNCGFEEGRQRWFIAKPTTRKHERRTAWVKVLLETLPVKGPVPDQRASA